MTILEERAVERLDKFHSVGVLDRLRLRRHTRARRAREEIDLAKSLSLGPCSTKLQVEPLPRALWTGSLRKNMHGDPA